MKNRGWSTLAALGMFVLAALPARASITYSNCSSGCTASSGGYAAVEAAGTGLTFNPIAGSGGAAFSALNLTAGTYADLATTFVGYSSSTTVSGLNVSGSSLVETVGGSGSGIWIVLPSDTFAIAMNIGSSGGHSIVIDAGRDVFASDYISTGYPGFFGIVSNTAISTIFVGRFGGGGPISLTDFKIGTQGSTVGDVPEPSSLFLLGGGLILLPLLRNLQTKRRSARAD